MTLTRTHDRRRLAATLGATALAATLAAGLVGCGSTGQESAPAAPAATTTADANAHNAQDVAFATGMIPHHEQAIVMSDMALTKTTNPQVKQLAQDIKAAQGPEIEQLRSWLVAWGSPATTDSGHSGHGATTPATTTTPGASGTSGGDGHGAHDDMDGMDGMDGMMSAQQMTALADASGATFDTLWLRLMIEHHEGAIAMATTQIDKGTNPAAVELAEQIISGQQGEIDAMRQMLAPTATPTSPAATPTS